MRIPPQPRRNEVRKESSGVCCETSSRRQITQSAAGVLPRSNEVTPQQNPPFSIVTGQFPDIGNWRDGDPCPTRSLSLQDLQNVAPTLESFDPLTTIVNWVETGTVPDFMLAANSNASQTTTLFPLNRTRLLCPYPQYDGTGDISSAASFTGVGPPARNAAASNVGGR